MWSLSFVSRSRFPEEGYFQRRKLQFLLVSVDGRAGHRSWLNASRRRELGRGFHIVHTVFDNQTKCQEIVQVLS